MWLTRMGRSFKTIAFSIYAAAFGNGVAVAQASEDLVTVFDGKKYTIAYYKSSVKNLPPAIPHLSTSGCARLTPRRGNVIGCVPLETA